MKITLSKSQWELIGNKTGWIKTAWGQDLSGSIRNLENSVKFIEQNGPDAISPPNVFNFSRYAEIVKDALVENQKNVPIIANLDAIVNTYNNSYKRSQANKDKAQQDLSVQDMYRNARAAVLYFEANPELAKTEFNIMQGNVTANQPQKQAAPQAAK